MTKQEKMRSYVLVLVAWWREIVGGAALVTVGVGAVVLVSQVLWPNYESSAEVLIVRAPTHVSLDDTIETMRESTGERRLRARRAALVGLVRNTNVARAVLERLQGLLGDEKMTEARLLRRIRGSLVIANNATLRDGSDLIRITARGDSPELAAAIASTWAEEYVRHTNQVSSRVPEELMNSVAAAAERARQDYDTAQRTLEEFVATTNIDSFPRLIEAKKQVVNELQALDLTTGVASIRASSNLLVNNYNARGDIVQLIGAAQGLRDQIEFGGEEGLASTGLALALLKIGAHAKGADLSGSLEIKIDGDAFHATAADQLADVDALVDALEKRVARSGEHFESLSTSLYTRADAGSDASLFLADAGADASDSSQWTPNGSASLEAGILTPIGRFIDSLEQEILLLESQYEATTSKRTSLVQARDNMRSAFDSLEKERVEMRLSRAAEAPELRVASPAIAPMRRSGLPLLPIVILAAIFGLSAMTCAAFLANVMNWRPFLKG